MEKYVSKEIIAGIINFALILVNVMVVTIMWQKAGVPFNGAYTAVVFSSILGTMVAAYYKIAVSMAPGIVVNSLLCYDLVICQGYTWQETMTVPFLAGLLILFLVYANLHRKLVSILPQYLETVIPASLGILLVYRGLVMGRLVIGDPFQLTSMGSLNDPLVIITIVSFVAVMVFLSRKKSQALAVGLLVALVMAIINGYVEVPAYIFSVPEGFTDTAAQINFDRFFELLVSVAVVFLVLLFDGLAVAKTMRENEAKLLRINGLGSLLGGLFSGGAMSVAEVSVASGYGSDTPAKISKVTVLLLVLLLFCGPMMMELKDYPVIFAASVIGAGCCLLSDLKFLQINDNISILAGVFTLMLVPLWGSLTAGIGFGLILYYTLKMVNSFGKR
ncbi:putative MFS transporter, AGZA family, xanthine/uracil permease [Anaerovibrio lipolyticus DSM 3074]|uniref:Xanthine/uracil/vitamin C permease n=2 Tax=Anaerovibrio lipolyticus TaxID=82374 RepID=A0A0B2JSR2_9FIRM|nr:hypothetical protein [Anaerovibrio lipolyticus]KHM49546.1 hypothetical protein NZ47_12695 [Anaerovibrio lipolyticus]SHI72712.1 putative MFS transporter, AGZA family, xanthine/uracil permease [Anaerovibrio lipolyticus DSM 3074]